MLGGCFGVDAETPAGPRRAGEFEKWFFWWLDIESEFYYNSAASGHIYTRPRLKMERFSVNYVKFAATRPETEN